VKQEKIGGQQHVELKGGDRVIKKREIATWKKKGRRIFKSKNALKDSFGHLITKMGSKQTKG